MPDFFLIIRVYGLGEETQGAESPCGRVVSINAITGLITDDVTSVTWLRGWLSSASHPFSAALLGNNLLRTDPSEKAGSYAPLTWASQAALVVKNSLTNAGTQRRGISPWVGKVPEGENGNLLQYSCLENPMDRGPWWATVHGFVKSQTRLSD